MEDTGFHEQNPGCLVQKASSAQQPGQMPPALQGRALHPTYHDNGDPSGGAVLFGERIIKVLF